MLPYYSTPPKAPFQEYIQHPIIHSKNQKKNPGFAPVVRNGKSQKEIVVYALSVLAMKQWKNTWPGPDHFLSIHIPPDGHHHHKIISSVAI